MIFYNTYILLIMILPIEIFIEILKLVPYDYETWTNLLLLSSETSTIVYDIFKDRIKYLYTVITLFESYSIKEYTSLVFNLNTKKGYREYFYENSKQLRQSSFKPFEFCYKKECQLFDNLNYTKHYRHLSTIKSWLYACKRRNIRYPKYITSVFSIDLKYEISKTIKV